MNAVELMCRATARVIDRGSVQAVVHRMLGLDCVAETRPGATRVVIPAAGLGTRFRANVPKAIAPGSLGRALILRVLDAVAPFDPYPVVVINSRTGADIQRTVSSDGLHQPTWILQREPRGMGDAVLATRSELEGYTGDVLVVWADMGAVCTANIFQALVLHQLGGRPLTVVSKRRRSPYVALLRSETGELADVLLRREGCLMPDSGESDCGLFWFRAADLFPALAHVSQATTLGEVTLWPLLRHFAQAGRAGLAALLSWSWQSQGVNSEGELAKADACMRRIYAQTSTDLASAGNHRDLLDALTLATLAPSLAQDVGSAVAAAEAASHGILHSIPPGTARAVRNLLSRSTSA